MSRMEINLPDPVLVWEIEYDMPNDKPQGVYVVRAEVGGVVVFERTFDAYDWQTGLGLESADEAKDRAAGELGEKLKGLLA